MILNIIYIFFTILISNFTFSADGYYEVQLMTKAVLRFDGVVIWQPPATYKGTPAKWIHKVAKKARYLKTPANKNSPLPYKILLWKTIRKATFSDPLKPFNMILKNKLQWVKHEFFAFLLLTFCWDVFLNVASVWLHNRRWILSLRHPDLPSEARQLELRRGKGALLAFRNLNKVARHNGTCM